MKKSLPIFFILFISCQNNSDPVTSDPASFMDTSTRVNFKPDSIATSKDIIPLKNQKDKNGKKQGIWDYYENGIMKGFKTYENDTLNGHFKYWINYPGQIFEGNYLKNKLEGIIKSYYDYSKREISDVRNYKNGNLLWMGFPHAVDRIYFPVKDFIIESDSVMIICPYENDVIWYTGLIINKKPVGIHKMYFPNGKLKFEVDYSLKTIKEFDSTGTIVSKRKEKYMQSWRKG